MGRAFAPDDEVVAIHVTDQGPGIPPDHLGRIFEPFFSTKGRGRGSGLGLAICHSLIEVLDGALVVQTELGAGTMVRVLLPTASARAALRPAGSRALDRGRNG